MSLGMNQLFVSFFAILYGQNRSALRNSERRSYDVTAISWQRMPMVYGLSRHAIRAN